MTGFGQGAAEGERLRATATLRAVNHRILDLQLRLREETRALEPALRQRLKERLQRGRVELVVEIELLGERPVEVDLDEPLVRRVHAVAASLQERGLIATEVSLGDLLRIPELVRVRPLPFAWSEEDEAVVHTALGRALEQLLESRAIEGAKLRTILGERLDALDDVRRRLAEHAAGAPAAAAEALRERIAALLEESPVDEARLAQEVALLVDKSDVREELDRLRSHLEHFRIVADKPGAIGKRLDFLTQEIFRELNTLGAKCRDAAMIRLVLDGKVCSEQLREQVQNVE